MGDGLSRRDLIKGAAVAGAAAWTAPIVYSSLSAPAGAVTTTCAGVKIPSCSAVNGGKVALCGSFTTDNPADFSSCVSPQCDTYHPSFGFFFKICGPVANDLTAIAVKWAGNAQTCTDTSTTADPDWNGSDCLTVDKSSSGGFGSGAYFSTADASWANCGTGVPATGNMIEMSAINGSYDNNDAGIHAPAAGANSRWLFLSAPGGLNEIGLAICFTFGSVPPTCAPGSCA